VRAKANDSALANYNVFANYKAVSYLRVPYSGQG